MFHMNFILLNFIIGGFSVAVALLVQSLIRYISYHVKLNQKFLSTLPLFCGAITFFCSLILNYVYNSSVK
jgi:hypothetical protein